MELTDPAGPSPSVNQPWWRAALPLGARCSLSGWPRQCEVCHTWASASVCEPCRTRFAPAQLRCMACALPLPPEAAAQHASGQTLCGECLRAPPPWTRCDAAVDYAFPWDRLVSRFKFGDRPDLARPLADLLIDALPPRPANAAPLLVTAVPLSDARLAERGYNQAWVLAQRLARARRWPAVPDLLLRCRDTPHQVGLGREARARNLRQALLANPARVGQIAGRDILVVDDVMTTGMTARAVALALHEAGAAAVHLAVVARTLPGQARSA